MNYDSSCNEPSHPITRPFFDIIVFILIKFYKPSLWCYIMWAFAVFTDYDGVYLCLWSDNVKRTNFSTLCFKFCANKRRKSSEWKTLSWKLRWKTVGNVKAILKKLKEQLVPQMVLWCLLVAFEQRDKHRQNTWKKIWALQIFEMPVVDARISKASVKLYSLTIRNGIFQPFCTLT